MKYSSTRGDSVQVTAAEAIIKGLAADSGLFVPDELPQISPSFIEELVPLSYEEISSDLIRVLYGRSHIEILVKIHMYSALFREHLSECSLSISAFTEPL